MADVEKVSDNPPDTKTGESRVYVDTEAEKGFGMFSRWLKCRANCVVRKVDCFVLPLLCLVCLSAHLVIGLTKADVLFRLHGPGMQARFV